MYIYNKPHARQAQSETAAPGGAMSSLATDASTPRPRPPSSLAATSPRPPPPPSSSASQSHAVLLHRPAKDGSRSALPFSLPPFFFGPSNASSTSLVSSTAEGRPIPLDDGTAAHRTSALRELNNNYPSPVLRHRYAKPTSAKNSTYSQPVIVRTYGGPPPAHSASTKPHGHGGHHRHSSTGRAVARRIPLSTASAPAPSLGFSPATTLGGVGISSIGKHAHGGLLTMGRHKAKKPSRWQWVPGMGGGRESDEPKLPPLEAFSFKSFMADVPENDELPAALDRIAEICARSRFSLSSQYEVHVPPYGPGVIITPNGQSSGRRRSGRHRREPGPTLQAVQSDDDENGARIRRRRPPRRASAAQGTLETIMSSHSSQSSKEEKKKKKKPAAQIVDEVRGRASGSAAGAIPEDTGCVSENVGEGKKVARRKSTSFAHAVMGTSWNTAGTDAASPRNSAAALVGPPALPQASSSHLEIRTAPEAAYQDIYRQDHAPASPTGSGADSPLSQELPHVEDTGTSNPGLLSGFNTWIPWNGAGPAPPSGSSRASGPPSQAAGSLRDLLKTVDGKQKKGKEVDRGT